VDFLVYIRELADVLRKVQDRYVSPYAFLEYSISTVLRNDEIKQAIDNIVKEAYGVDKWTIIPHTFAVKDDEPYITLSYVAIPVIAFYEKTPDVFDIRLYREKVLMTDEKYGQVSVVQPELLVCTVKLPGIEWVPLIINDEPAYLLPYVKYSIEPRPRALLLLRVYPIK